MKRNLLIIIATALLFAASQFCWAITVDIGQGSRIFVPVKSFKELRDEHVIKQAFDYSCGAAALATLLTYGLMDTVSEREILSQAMSTLSAAGVDLRRKEGLSLLDLQRVSEARGHKAMGFRLNPRYLSKLEMPVMVYIEPRNYEHFAVLKGVRGNMAYLADPSLGNTRMPLYRFLDMWLGENGEGIIFVVEHSDGSWPDSYPLKLKTDILTDPAIASSRQMLEQSSHSPQLIQPLLLPR
jgi:predicted double-glycine peptidase